MGWDGTPGWQRRGSCGVSRGLVCGVSRGLGLGLRLGLSLGTMAGLAGLARTAGSALASSPPAELAVEPVARSEPDRIELRWTPEFGWQGEYQLRLAAGLAAGQPEQGAPGRDQRWAVDLGLVAKAHSFTAEAAELTDSPPGLGESVSLQPVSIQLNTRGPLWTGGAELEGVLGDFRLDWSPEFGGDVRRNRVRGVQLKTDSWTLWAGWPRDGVPPLRHAQEQPGADHRLWGCRWGWSPPPEGQGVSRLQFEAGGRSGTVVLPRGSGQPFEPSSYREAVGGLTVRGDRGSWRWRAEAGVQERLWRAAGQEQTRAGYEVDGFGWVQLRKDQRGTRNRIARWQVDAYAVSAGFHPWAAQRAKANPLYGWRGERAVQVERVAWVDLPLPVRVNRGSWRLDMRLAVGDRARVIPELAEFGEAPGWRSPEPAGSLASGGSELSDSAGALVGGGLGQGAGYGSSDRLPFVRGVLETSGPVGSWLNVTGSGAWQSVVSGWSGQSSQPSQSSQSSRSTSQATGQATSQATSQATLPTLPGLSVTAWGRLELARAVQVKLGAWSLRCQPSYKISWQSAEPAESEGQGGSWATASGGSWATRSGGLWAGSPGGMRAGVANAPDEGDSPNNLDEADGAGGADEADGAGGADEADGAGGADEADEADEADGGASSGAAPAHQLAVRMGWGRLGSKKPAVVMTVGVGCDRSRPPIWELTVAWDSPNGWEWRFKRTWPDEAGRQSDSYLVVRQSFPW